MKGKRLIWILLIASQFVFSQIKGIVKDSISGEPIPYVNIWVENENIGTTSDTDGSFSITLNTTSKNLIFSSLGYDKKIIKAVNAANVFLVSNEVELNEVVLLNKKERRFLEIGKTKNTTYQTFDNGPKIEAKYFPYSSKYSKTKFIKYITLFADCGIDTATVKIHLYSVDENGAPGKELLNKEYLAKLKKGVFKYKFNVSDFNLVFPENGLFVAYEKLMIASNRTERIITDPNTKKSQTKVTHHPFVIYNYVERDFFYTFSGGKWTKHTNETNPLEPLAINEPAINIILSN